jgi:UDP-galactopyranose mutase
MMAGGAGLARQAPDMLCFSHLRWDWVWQRPQQLLTRLARRRGGRIFFVEEPLPRAEARTGQARPGWQIDEVAPGITRCVPLLDATWPFFLDDGGEDTRAMHALLGRLIEEHAVRAPLVWVYTPLAVPLLGTPGLAPNTVVYDCMDELANFAGAPPELRARESQLLRVAVCVFTGGRSMYEARLGRHDNLHLFPSSIDVAHFAAAGEEGTPMPPDARPAGHRPGQPTLGFYGVLDERLDRDLLDAVAALRPGWSFVLVGPVAKIDPARLPQRPNIAYPGQRPYEALPGYLKGWDVCLMPFALNDATRYISPTKTLEYLAAGKPVVSTSVPDVAAGYREVVRFGDTPEAFVAACEAALAEPPAERASRQARARALLAQTSWDATVARMAALIDAADASAASREAEQGATVKAFAAPRNEPGTSPATARRDRWAERLTGS